MFAGAAILFLYPLRGGFLSHVQQRVLALHAIKRERLLAAEPEPVKS